MNVILLEEAQNMEDISRNLSISLDFELDLRWLKDHPPVQLIEYVQE